MSWSSRPNPEDQINRKPEAQKNDGRTENTENRRPQKIE